jgi:hypothetical protein
LIEKLFFDEIRKIGLNSSFEIIEKGTNETANHTQVKKILELSDWIHAGIFNLGGEVGTS